MIELRSNTWYQIWHEIRYCYKKAGVGIRSVHSPWILSRLFFGGFHRKEKTMVNYRCIKIQLNSELSFLIISFIIFYILLFIYFFLFILVTKGTVLDARPNTSS